MDPQKERQIEIETLTLEKLRIVAVKILDGNALRDMRITLRPATYADELMLTLSTYLSGERLKEEEHIFNCSYPATTWQHFKQQFFPSWLEKKFPVKQKTETQSVKFIQYAVFPKMAKVLNGRQAEYSYLTTKDIVGE